MNDAALEVQASLFRITERTLTDALTADATQMAKNAAESAAALVINDAMSAEMATEHLARVDKGAKFLKERSDEILRDLAEFLAGERGRVNGVVQYLQAASRALRASLAHYMDECDRKAAAELKEREAAARKAEEENAVLGEDAPPPVEVSRPLAVRTINTKAGGVHKSKVLDEPRIVNLEKVPLQWLMLNTALAKAEWKGAVARGEVNPAGQEWNGVEFRYRTTIVRH
jgi:hypothetical protein